MENLQELHAINQNVANDTHDQQLDSICSTIRNMDLLKTIHDERPNWVSDFIRKDVYGKSTCLGEAEEIGGAKNPQQAIEVK